MAKSIQVGDFIRWSAHPSSSATTVQRVEIIEAPGWPEHGKCRYHCKNGLVLTEEEATLVHEGAHLIGDLDRDESPITS